MTEADYICFLAKDITLGYFPIGGFTVLPRSTNDPKSVYFPDLNYSQEFWSAIKRTKSRDLGDIFPKVAVDEVVSKLTRNNTSQRISKEGFDIELLETEYGTCGSYFVRRIEGYDVIFMTKRIGDLGAEFDKTFLLAKLIIKNRDRAEMGEIKWYKRQGVLEYFHGKTKSKLSQTDIKEGHEYLAKLGFAEENVIQKIDFKVFTKQEENLLKKMIDMNGKILSFDESAQVLWGEGSYDKYSPQAMAKVVENIRSKIKDQGINKELIFTKRGKGYILNK
jgi:hypothetical protein